jgi:hypothetical protein
VYIRRLPAITVALCLATAALPIAAQTLSLSSSTIASAGAASLSLAFSAGTTPAAALQWTIQYPATGISAIAATAGPALTAAGKTLQCTPGTGAYTCVASGMNSTAIASGVVATLAVTAGGTSPLTLSNTLAADPTGTALTSSSSGGTVSVGASVPTLSSLACSATSLSGASSSTCTVTLSAAATAATTVALTSNNPAVKVPASVTIAAGSTTAPFTATSSGSTNAAVTLTAALSGVSQTATLTLTTTAVPTLTTLACNPTSLSGASSSSCTVTLSAAATAATAVALSSNNTAVVVPESVNVLAGSATAHFSAVASSSLNATVVLTATLNGTPKTTNLALTTSTFSARLHASDGSYVDPQGFTWQADNSFTGGSLYATSNTVANTNMPLLYKGVRYGSFSYQFTVPNGNYTVNLKFAEIVQNSIGQRVFSVAVNGTAALSNFDVVAAAGGPFVAIDKAIPVTVNEGVINIAFVKQVGDPMINAIEIVQGTAMSQTMMTAPTALAVNQINAGGPSYTDREGVVWSADQEFTGGSTWSTTEAITNTATPALYQTCRYGEFYYPIAVPNGAYTVTLKFAEISRTAAGQRQFNVQIDGVPVLTNFDIIKAIGGPNIAVDKTFSATVTNGVLVLGFTAGAADLPLVSAIQITPAQ